MSRRASFCWTIWSPSHTSTVALLACLALLTGPICAAQTALPSPALNLGSVNVGATSASGTVSFTFESGGTLDATKPFQVVTQGVLNLDFKSAAGSTCNGTTTYTPGQSCQVNVTFSSQYPGQRYGAVLLYGSAGSVIATAYVYGTAIGPLAAFPPTTSSVVPGANAAVEDFAIDASGDVFLAEQKGLILKDTVSGGDYIQTTIAQLPASEYTNGITVDGAGNLFITNGSHVYEVSPSGTGYTQSVAFGGLDNSNRIAVDGSGNLFITEPGKVIKAVRSVTGYTHSAINSSDAPYAVAVDGSGNVYVSNSAAVYKLTPSGNTYTQSTVAQGGEYGDGLAVDSAGDVYFDVVDGVFIATPSAGGYTQSAIAGNLGSPGSIAHSIALGQKGNLFVMIGFSSDDGILKLPLFTPPGVTFYATADGSVSGNSPQPVTVMNIGNSPLTFPIPESGDNPSISANFTLDSSGEGDCPLSSSGSSTAGTLASGASCMLLISFEPESPAYGTVNGTLNLTDNTLDAAAPGYAVQTIALVGTASSAPPFGNLDSATNSTTGSLTVGHCSYLNVIGWAGDPTAPGPMSNVIVYIDGISVGKPTLGIARPDIAAKYGSAYLDTGYQLLYSAASLTTGTHNVTVVATDSLGIATTFGPLTFAVSGAPPFGHLDTAADNATGSSTIPHSDTLKVAGWVADQTDHAPLSNVTVYIDTVSFGTPTLGIPRPDVVAKNGSADLDSGYKLLTPAASLSIGSHLTTVTAIDSGGCSTTFGPLVFTVTAAPGS